MVGVSAKTNSQVKEIHNLNKVYWLKMFNSI